MKIYLLLLILTLSYFSCLSKKAACLGHPLPDDISAGGCLLFPLLYENSISRDKEELKNENLSLEEIKSIESKLSTSIFFRDFFVINCLNGAIRNEGCKNESNIYPNALPK